MTKEQLERAVAIKEEMKYLKNDWERLSEDDFELRRSTLGDSLFYELKELAMKRKDDRIHELQAEFENL